LLLLFVFAAVAAHAANINLGGSVSTTGTSILGASAVSFASDANHTLSVAEYTNNFLAVTSGVSLTAQRSLIAPLVQGQKFDVQNSTTGGQSVLVIGASGAGVVVPNGSTLSVVCDGTNYLTTAPTQSVAGGGPDLAVSGTTAALVGQVLEITGNSAGNVPIDAGCTTLAATTGLPVVSCIYSTTNTGGVPAVVYVQPSNAVPTARWECAVAARDGWLNAYSADITPFGTKWDGGSGNVLQVGTQTGNAIGVVSDTFLADASAYQWLDAGSVAFTVACPTDGGSPGTVCQWSIICQQQQR
jgi:hypothetical protein